MNRRTLHRALILALAFACLWSGMICAQAASKAVKKIKLPEIVVLVKGKTTTLKPKLSPSGATAEITWTTSDKSIVKVKSGGVIKGVKIGEAYVYASADGKEAKCLVRVVKKVGFYKSNGKTYYCYPSTGLLAKGLQKIDGKKYYFDPVTGAQKVGLTRLDNGRTYNFLKNGGYSKGLTKIKKNTYYFHKSKGYMLTGLQKISGKTYYFLPDSGAMAKGLQTVKNKPYFFDRSTGEQKTGLIKVDGKTYNFLKAGGVSKGLTAVGADVYYFHKTSGEMLTGFVTVDGATYYFKPGNGKMQKGLQTINGKKYYFGENGKLQTGFQTADGRRYYFDPGTGVAVTGLRTIDGDTYYFDESYGYMRFKTQTINDKKYYFDDETGKQRTGFIQVGNGIYNYLKAGGVSKGLTDIDGDTYYFDENSGSMRFKTQTINGKKYYFDDETGKQRTGFIQVGKGVYNYLKEGDVSKGWTDIGSNRYYFDEETGSMRTGVQTINGKPYYFETPTGELVTGVRQMQMRDGNYYYFFFDPNEAIGFRKGLQEYQGDYYLFREKGNYPDALTGYCSLGSKVYYFDPENGCKARKNTSWGYKGLLTMKADGKGVITPVNNGSPRSMVLEWALKHVGASYGTGSGQYTCSSFSAGAYAYAGKNYLSNINPGAQVQALLALQHCDKIVKGRENVDQLQPGDLIFWDREDIGCGEDCLSRFTYNGTAYHIHHVGIYFGDGQIVEAADETLGTLVQNVPDDEPGVFFVAFGADLLSADIPDAPEVNEQQYRTNGQAYYENDEGTAAEEEARTEPPAGTLASDSDEGLAIGSDADPVPEEREAEESLLSFEGETVDKETEDQDGTVVLLLD